MMHMPASKSMIVLLGTCVAVAAAVGGGRADSTQADEDEVGLEVKQLPPVIRSALVGVEVAEAERAWSEGREVYLVELRAGGAELELKLGLDGQLLAVEVESARNEREDDDADDEEGSNDEDRDDGRS